MAPTLPTEALDSVRPCLRKHNTQYTFIVNSDMTIYTIFFKKKAVAAVLVAAVLSLIAAVLSVLEQFFNKNGTGRPQKRRFIRLDSVEALA